MRKLIFVEDNFISEEDCQRYIKLSKENQNPIPYGDVSRGGDTYLTTVEWENQGARYLGGDVDSIVPSEDSVIARVNALCKSFDSEIELDYVGVVRWPIGTFMKPHVDDNNIHNPDVFAAMLYLNDDFGVVTLCLNSMISNQRWVNSSCFPTLNSYTMSARWRTMKDLSYHSGIRG